MVRSERRGGGVVDAQLSAFADVNHIAAGNRLNAGNIVARRRGHGRGKCHRSGAGVVDGEAAVNQVAAGALSDKELVVGAEGNGVMNAVADHRAGAGG